MLRFIISNLLLLFVGTSYANFTVSYDTILMGSSFSFTAVHTTESDAWKAIRAGINEVIRIEQKISSWNPKSETSAINTQAGIAPVPVSRELFDLIYRSKKISELSNGHFDISFASLEKVWFYDGSMTRIPDEDEVLRSVRKINYQNIILNPDGPTVFLKAKGMRIGFGAIGKGYAANRAKQQMTNLGAFAGVVNAGGDLLSWGHQSDGRAWTVGIADPTQKGNIISSLDITDLAVVTSGNYERFATINGQRFGHIINPRTGWPVDGTKSVTIVCPDAELADALATTVFVLGPVEGLKLINHLQGVEAIIINEKSDILLSDNIQLELLHESQ